MIFRAPIFCSFPQIGMVAEFLGFVNKEICSLFVISPFICSFIHESSQHVISPYKMPRIIYWAHENKGNDRQPKKL